MKRCNPDSNCLSFQETKKSGWEGWGVTFNDMVLNKKVKIEDLSVIIKRICSIRTIQKPNYRKKKKHC